VTVRLVSKEKELIPDPIEHNERLVQWEHDKLFILSLEQPQALKLGQRIIDLEINVDAKRR
jgi:hypothetical protein